MRRSGGSVNVHVKLQKSISECTTRRTLRYLVSRRPTRNLRLQRVLSHLTWTEERSVINPHTFVEWRMKTSSLCVQFSVWSVLLWSLTIKHPEEGRSDDWCVKWKYTSLCALFSVCVCTDGVIRVLYRKCLNSFTSIYCSNNSDKHLSEGEFKFLILM